ncbi:MAG: tetratricopeptide repeat protein [Anaerolineae bacterium]|nr:tetratricopeptide repeat protein [Anaerolineae bacterium]
MPGELLTTKLYIPPVRTGLVPRPRLIERLNEGLRRRLTLVSAPTGFGKTTLLSEWVSQLDVPVGWVSLDEGDNDPARILGYLTAALQMIIPGAGETALRILQSPQPSSAEIVLTSLINDITASTQNAAGPDSFILALDDYHVITDQIIHDALGFLIDHLPPNMHLVIATRSDPPLPLPRLRGRGDLTELRIPDLRFTPGEAAEFLNQTMGLALSVDEVAALDSRIEGWVAGLRMAAVSMQGIDDAAGFIRAFTGSNRYIMDYLVEEVLKRQPPDIMQFLIQTSVLERLTAPLCDAITGRDDSQPVLEQIERDNLFIIPLDSKRRWFRYHHLFATLLRQRLDDTSPDEAVDLHRRACDWYEKNDHFVDAIHHALVIEDFGRAADLAEKAAEIVLMRSEIRTLLKWIDDIPNDVVQARPLLCLYHAGALLLSGHPLTDIEARMKDAAGENATAPAPGEMAVFDALFALFQGDSGPGTALARQALEMLTADRVFLRSVVTFSLGMSNMLGGDFEAAIETLTESSLSSQKAGNPMIAVTAIAHVAEIAVMQGQLHRARELAEKAADMAVDEYGRTLPVQSLAFSGLGELFREWNELDTAAAYLQEGIELAGEWATIGAVEGYVTLARVRQAQGNEEGACQAIEEAWHMAVGFDASSIDDILVDLHRARLWIMQGDIEAASAWLEARPPARDTRHFYFSAPEQATSARIHLALGQTDKAMEVVDGLLAQAEQLGMQRYVIESLVLKSLVYQAQGDSPSALETLESALSLAKPEGYIRIFVDEGEPMARLLRQAALKGIQPDYVTRLLDAFPGAEAGPKAAPQSAAGELVSEREMEVMRLVAAGLTNQEIAARLDVSLSTIKWYLYHLYDRLDVRNRTEAIARLKELGLISS